VHRVDRSSPNGIKRFLSNRDYDLRLISSSIGGGISNWIIDMMFCSSLGVCFPDASGRICKLVESHKYNALTESEYTKKFNQIIAEDATVLPLHHTGSLWIFGTDLSSDGISPISPVPGIEQLSLQ